MTSSSVSSDTQFNPRGAGLTVVQDIAVHCIQNRPLFNSFYLVHISSHLLLLLQTALQVRFLCRQMGRYSFPPFDLSLACASSLVKTRLNIAQSCKKQARVRLVPSPLHKCIQPKCHVERLLLFLPHGDHNCTQSHIPINIIQSGLTLLSKNSCRTQEEALVRLPAH